MTEPSWTPARTAQRCEVVLDEIERTVVGRRRSLELVLMGILASGHVLLEDLPGLGKTLIARSFATALGLDFARIQFTPDLLPSDVVGAPLYDQRTAQMVFRPGPARCSPSCCWPTRSTGRRPKPRPRCWKRWARARSAWTG